MPKVRKVCPFCECEFFVFPCLVERKKYCGKSCYSKYQSTLTGSRAFFFGKKLSAEVKAKISEQMSTRRGDLSPSWKGGKWKLKTGYIAINLASLSQHDLRLVGPMTRRSNSNFVPEHRLIVARRLGRPLSKDEHVHHINGIKSDNRDENLEILHVSPHTKEHWRVIRELLYLRRENEILKKAIASTMLLAENEGAYTQVGR